MALDIVNKRNMVNGNFAMKPSENNCVSFRKPTDQHETHVVWKATSSSASESDFKSAIIFNEIKSNMEKDGASWVKKMRGVFCFRVKSKDGAEGVWVVDAKNGNGSVTFGAEPKGDVKIIMADEDMYNLMLGTLNPQQAFFSGKLKIQGNMGLAMKLREFQSRAEEFTSEIKSKL